MGRPFDSIGPKLTSLINWASGLPDFRSALPDSIAAQSISAQPFLEGPRSLAPVLGCSPSLRFPSFPFLPPRHEAAKPARRTSRFPRAPQPNQRTAIARNLPHNLSPPRLLQPAIVPPASMTSSGDEGRVMVDLRSAAESVARAGDEAAHDTPIQEIESLCMRCGKNVSTPVAYLSLPVVSFGSIQCVCSGF